MSKLGEKIKNDLKGAMQDKNKTVLSVLRMLVSAMQNKEISIRKGGKAELNDEQIIAVIQSEVKKRKDSIEAYEKGNRQELADKEKQEIAVLEEYLPKQMSDEEIGQVVKEIIETSDSDSAENFGKIMGQAMAKVKGLADGGKVSEIVKKVLSG